MTGYPNVIVRYPLKDDPYVTEHRPGVYYGMPADAYHRVESMSASGSKKILRSPQHYRLERDTPSVPTPQKQFGTAVHTGALEPEKFYATVIAEPADAPDKPTSRQVTAKKPSPSTLEVIAWWSDFNKSAAGKLVLSTADFDRARRCVDAVHASPAASALLDGAKTEVSLFWQDKLFDVPCKARLDILNGGIADLKTCVDASPEGFSRAIGTFDYHIQGWSNFSGSEHVLDATPEFFAFICVESEPPHAVAVYQLGRESLMAGARLWDESLARYKRALAAGKWEGYPQEIQTINAPRYKLKFEA